MKKLAIHGGPKSITKFFDLGATYFEEEITAVTDVIKSQTISGFVANDGPKFYGGKKVKELESLFREYFSMTYAVASNSATSSLHTALVAIGIGRGDEVIVPAVSMSATAASILMVGAKPVFVDINNGRCSNCHCNIRDNNNRGCFNINTDLIEEKITEKTKAIMVVHLFGKSADMVGILELSKKYNLKHNYIDFVFHGGSGSTVEEIREGISYGVIKMNIDTDMQYAYMTGARDYFDKNSEYLKAQIGNPDGSDVPNKKYYDPRVWVRKAEVTFVERLKQAFKDLNNVNTL